MKSIIIALTVAIGVSAIALPASAGYKAHNAHWSVNAFSNGD